MLCATHPLASIVLSSHEGSAPEQDLLTLTTTGRLLGPAGELAGECRFASYRKKPAAAPLDAARICRALDALSQEEEDLGAALALWNPQRLESDINARCLLVAERVEVFAPFKGTGAWKALYFATLEKALAAQPARPEEFFFTVFPLDFSGRVSRANLREFRLALRHMKLFYAAHLDARTLGRPGTSGSFMRAPVPESRRDCGGQ